MSNWTDETMQKIERIFDGECPMDAIEGVAYSIVDERLVQADELVDPSMSFGTWEENRGWFEITIGAVAEDHCEPPLDVMMPTIAEAAIVLAADPVFVAHVKAECDQVEKNAARYYALKDAEPAGSA